MKYAVWSLLAGAALAAPSPASSTAPTCASQVVSKLSTVNSQLVKTEAAANSFSAGLLDLGALLEIQVDSCDLGDKIQDTTSQLNRCQQFDDNDSITVAEATLNMLPQINATLNAIVNKKSEFQHAVLDLISVTLLVQTDLKSLKSDTDALSKAIQSKVSSEFQSSVTTVQAELDAWFTSAINAF